MKKRLAAALVTFLMLAATFGIMFFYFAQLGNSAPKAEKGYLDLTGWDFANDGIVPLDGEWEFYPHRLLSQGNLEVAETDGANEIRVPGSWTSVMDRFGAATYRLQIMIGDANEVFGLKTSSIQVSNRVFVNGVAVGESGNPAERGSYMAMNKPFAGYFPLHAGWNEIIVQVANYDLKAGSGINESIYFGHADQIIELRDMAMMRDWITVTSFLIIGLYFIGLYVQRKIDPSLIAFGILCVLIAIFSSTRGERVIFSLIGPFPFWLYLRIQMISVVAGGMTLFFYIYTAFRQFCSGRFVKMYIAAGAVLTLLTVGLIDQLFTEAFRQLTSIYSTFPFLYATYVFVLAAFHRVEGSLYLSIAALALNAHVLITNLNVYFGLPMYRVAPVETVLFLLMLTLLMSLRFSNAFRKNEELSVQLLKADKLKDEFLARTTHEFKTPLHGIMNISTTMLTDDSQSLTAEQKERLKLISSIAGRLSQLVYDILDFSKLKEGELIVQPAPVDVRSAVEVNMRIYSFLSSDRNIHLENLVPEQLPYALADESRLSQILGNLLDNAIKYTSKGSVIVTAQEKEGMIEISVHDTGEGIEEADLPHIFEPFRSRGDFGGQRGFGLGLSIVKQLVELQDGEISITSTKGVGTSVAFTLPVAVAAKTMDKLLHRNGPDAKGLEYSFPTPYYLDQQGTHTILIADDHYSNLKVLVDALQPLGYNVIAVKDGLEALEQMEKPNIVDLVILDLMMPKMSGFEVCQAIRSKYTLLEMPVLMVTAAIQPQDKVAAFEAGANDFLPKPFDLAELKARIASLLVMKDSFRKAVHMEVAFLQSQIKPHFLFNVLNSIISLSYTDVELSRKLTTDLAYYLRGSFRFGNVENRISFAEEFDLIQTYVGIEQTRFKDRIHVVYDVAEPLFNVKIPPLLIQPLVENAIRHGIGAKVEGGTVKISGFKDEDGCCFVVEDDGVGMDREQIGQIIGIDSAERKGVGLRNIHKRLIYEYGTELQVDSRPGVGTKVTVRIPFPNRTSEDLPCRRGPIML